MLDKFMKIPKSVTIGVSQYINYYLHIDTTANFNMLREIFPNSNSRIFPPFSCSQFIFVSVKTLSVN